MLDKEQKLVFKAVCLTTTAFLSKRLIVDLTASRYSDGLHLFPSSFIDFTKRFTPTVYFQVMLKFCL